MGPLLEVRDATKTFPDAARTVALRGVSIRIDAGDFVAITGPSGGGKSTLLNLLGLLDAPTTGTVEVEGVDVAGDDARATRLRARLLSFVFQSFHLLDRRPVFDSVELGPMYAGVPRRQRRESVRDALIEVGLLEKVWQAAGVLSGGERQRVAIARALASRSAILIADEPTGNLDSANAQAITELLQRLHAHGVTVVLVTHSEEVASSAARVVQLRDGAIVGDQRLRPPPVPAPSLSGTGRGSRPHLPLSDLALDAWRSVRAGGKRTAGLVGAVAVSVALAVATFGVSVSAAAQVGSTFDAFTSRDVGAQWTPDQLDALPASERAALLTRIDALNGVELAGLVSELGPREVQATTARPALIGGFYGLRGDAIGASRSEVLWAAGGDRVLDAGEVLLGETLAQQLQLAAIDRRPTVLVAGVPYTVAGLIRAAPRFPELQAGIVAAESTLASPEVSQVRLLVITRVGAAQQVGSELPLALNPYEPDSIPIEVPVDPSTLRDALQADVQNTLVAFTVVGLLAAVIALANSMWLSVLQRRHEIGLRRAVGARRRDISSLILIESLLIGAAGGILGAVLGLLGVLAITIVRQWAPVLDLFVLPASALGGAIVGVAGGLFAAIRGSRIPPGSALRD